MKSFLKIALALGAFVLGSSSYLHAATAPSITTQPSSKTVNAGASASFSVVASGTPAPTYQWKKGTTNISGATSATYTIAATTTASAGTYSVVVTNSAGSVTSASATLTINVAPAIPTQPTSKTVSAGASASFTVVATGTPAPTYQWKMGTTAISSATGATYTIAATTTANAGTYSVVVTNSVGSVTSSSATLTVNATVAPTITTQPVNKTVTAGASASFTVVATGTPAPTYQWKKGTIAISGATSATYTIAATTTASAGTYSVVVTNSVGSVTSSSATLTVNATVAPTITTQPVSRTVAAGASASFTVVAAGTPAPTYQWKKGTTAISGATSATYTIPATVTGDAGTYSVVVTNSAGSVTSTGATLNVTSGVAPTITTQPVSRVVNSGASVSFTVVATGTPAPTYRWKKGTTSISGATSATYTIASVATGNVGTHSVVVTNSAGSVTSTNATLALNTPPTVSLTQPPAYSSYTLPATIHLAATASDADGTVAKVEFFAGSSKLGESFAAPYTFDWSATAAGAVVLTARATDNLGATKTSAAIGIQSMPGLPYTADFETPEGYATGTLNSQLGWNVTAGTALVTNSAAAHGTQSVVLNIGAVAAKVDQEFGPGATNPPDVFVDFFAKPVAGADTAAGTVFDVDVAQVAFVQNGVSGAFAVLDGDGNGAGEWRTLGTPVALGADHAATDWQRLTLALHYTTKTWDLFVGSQPVAADLKFRLDTSAYLNLFSLKGHTATSARLDDFYVGVTNPLFADINNDGIDDAWETAHGLSLAVNQRDLDSDGDGLTNLEEYVLGTDPMKVDTDGDGLSDAVELALGTNPLTAGSYGPALPVSGARLHLRADLGPVTDGAGLVSRWVNLASLGSDALQSDPNRRPSRVANQLNGLPTVHFSGNDQVLYLPDLMAGAIAGEIIAVTKVGDKRTGGFGDLNNKLWAFDQNGAGYYPGWESDLEFSHYNTFGSDPGLGTSVPVSLVSNYHIFDTVTSAALCAEYFNGALWQSGPGQQASFASEPNLGAGVLFGDFAEIIVFDRALDDAERDLVGRYLTRKYRPESLPVPAKPTLRVFPVSGTKVDLDWSSSTATAAGTTATIERQTGSGAFVVVAIPVNVSTYSDTGLDSGQHYTYRVTLENWAGVSPASDSQSIATLSSPTLPADGLRLWLRSTAGTQGEGPLARWADQSGRGSDGVQIEPSRQPVVIAGQLNGLPVVRFNQSQGSVLAFPDLMAQALGGEAIVVVRRSSTGENVGLWGFGLSHGSRYPEGDGELFDDFATNAWVGTGPAPTLIEGFHIYDVGGDATKWFQVINGTVQLQRTTNTVGFRVDPVIGSGQGFDGPGPGFDGDIAEILIYDRVLSGPDRTVITRYLDTKYSFGIVFDTVPPTQPSSVVATKITASSFVLNWTGSSDDVSVAGYEVYRDGVSLGFTVAPNFAVTGMTPESVHDISVLARDTSGNLSASSETLRISTRAAMTAPSGIVVSANSSSAITVSWTAASDDTGVVSYNVFENGAMVGNTTGTSFTLQGLVPSGTYNFTVVAVDDAGNTSPTSSATQVTTPDGIGTGACPSWAIVVLPADFVSMKEYQWQYHHERTITPEGIACVFKQIGQSYTPYRWRNGNLELLTESSPGGGLVFINRNGAIARQCDRTIDFWAADSTTPRTIRLQSFPGASLTNAGQYSAGARYASTKWTYLEHQRASLCGLSDDDRVWFTGIESCDVGVTFRREGVQDTSRYADCLVRRSYVSAPGAQSWSALDSSAAKWAWPACNPNYGYPGVGTANPGFIVDWVSPEGVPGGSVLIENGPNWNEEWRVGTRVIDQEPLYINANGTVITEFNLIFADSSVRELPFDAFYKWVDNKDQAHGYDPRAQQYLYCQTKVVNGTSTTGFVYYRAVPVPDGWTTDLTVPLDTEDCQIGAMTNTSTQEKRTFIAVPAAIAVDANRDGQISFPRQGNFDVTSAEKPFRFWLNDDDDVDDDDPEDSENAPIATADYTDDKIDGIRDLEDFSRLKIYLGGLQDAVLQGQIQIGLKWKDTTGSPSLKVWRNLSPNGGTEYLTDVTVARQQLWFGNPGLVQGTTNYIIPTEYWKDVGLSSSQPYGNLLFEGCTVGKGQLVITLHKADGTVIGEGPGVWIDLKNIKSMYERVKATADGAETFPLPYNHVGSDPVPTPAMGWTPDPNGFPFEPAPGESATYIVSVHGWNQTYERSTMYAETMFKRMWHRGYKGRFVRFRWPTFTGLTTYNNSEYRAWKCGVSLKQYLDTLPSSFTINLVAHSMGNIVAGSALEKGASVANYALLNAAVPAICYDPSGNVVQTSWGYVTPNDDPDSATASLSYQGRFASVSCRLVNFFLPTDSALKAWEINNDSPSGGRFNPLTGSKPHQWPEDAIIAGYRYQRTATTGKKLRIVRVAGERALRSPDEAMGFAVQASSLTVGADGRTQGSIVNSVDMTAFSFDREHSAEFMFTIQKTQTFYETLLLELRVSTAP